MSEVAVACCQLALEVGRVEANRAACRAAISHAARDGAQVVVVPELANSGYVFADAAEARRCAETAGGETVSEWIALAAEHDLVVIGGLCELDEEARVRNSAVIVDRDGLRALYRKVHLWDREELFFEPGAEPPPAVDTAHGRIAVIVCYDAEFPEWVRLPALAGAELLCVPTNWPREAAPLGERPVEVARLQGAAASNRICIAACDRAGSERGVEWLSGSVIVGADGYPVAGPVCEDRAVTLLARLDLAQARRKRISEHNDVLADRRPELYGPLVG